MYTKQREVIILGEFLFAFRTFQQTWHESPQTERMISETEWNGEATTTTHMKSLHYTIILELFTFLLWRRKKRKKVRDGSWAIVRAIRFGGHFFIDIKRWCFLRSTDLDTAISVTHSVMGDWLFPQKKHTQHRINTHFWIIVFLEKL